MPPRRGCRLAVANEAFFHNAQFVIIRPMPAAFTIGCGKYFDLSTIDKVGHKLGLTIGLSLRSDGHRRRFTYIQPGKPQQNAYIERYNRTVRGDWLSQYIFETIEEAQDQPTEWLWTYNNERPNMGIGGMTPAMKLKTAV